MKKFLLIAFVLTSLAAAACFTTTHKVGNGGTGKMETTERQWFALWGVLPFKETDTTDMAGGAKDYTVKVERNVVDVIIGIFTGFVTIYPQTVTVTK